MTGVSILRGMARGAYTTAGGAADGRFETRDVTVEEEG
jgi:hypothetical protein